jgi:hypothetical protein
MRLPVSAPNGLTSPAAAGARAGCGSGCADAEGRSPSASCSGSSRPSGMRTSMRTPDTPGARSAVLSICSIACSREHPGSNCSNVASNSSCASPFCARHASNCVPGGTWLA